MPHIEIQCFFGRAEEQKKQCAEKIADVVAETLGYKASSVSVCTSQAKVDTISSNSTHNSMCRAPYTVWVLGNSKSTQDALR